MKLSYLSFLIPLLIFPGLFSCKQNHFKVRTSDIKVDIEVIRFEKELFTMTPDEIPGKISGLRDKYDGFLQLFSYVINTGDINDPSFADFLVRFCTDRQNNDVYGLTIKVFPDVDDIEKGLEDAFSHYLFYFPGKIVPSVYTCITGFNTSIITGDSVLAIGLDRYLGADCSYYKQLEVYSYLAARMTPLYILPDCIYGWGVSEWDFALMNYPDDNVLSEMIHEGKLRYFEKCMLPETPDNVIFGFTPDQMKFCLNNESRMWLYLVENDLVFSTDKFTIRKLIGEGPFTSYFTNESPGRAAGWIGFRIVESFMMKNPGVSLNDLMNNVDIQGILEKSKYNPQ